MNSSSATLAQPSAVTATLPRRSTAQAMATVWRHPIAQLAAAYLLILLVHALLGRWTPEFLHGRDLWHFMFSRMIVPMLMLAFFAAFIRIFPAALLLSAMLLFIGAISAIKREATGEPFQISDLFLAGQGMHLFSYVTWDKWLMAAPLLPSIYYAARNIRLRVWTVPLLVACAALLSSYRYQPVVDLIHKHAYWTGIENLTFSQAESERMNGLGTHLYFSTAGLRLKTFATAEVDAAMQALSPPPPLAARTQPAPDVYVILGEAWWRDPADENSPIDKAVRAGFQQVTGISPVYGGTTPNAEFEVLTGVPMKSFPSGIIPFQHYVSYFTPLTRALPRLLAGTGYETHAYHNFTPRFWLRDQNYPTFGFSSFHSMDEMTLQTQANGWPTDAGLFANVLATPAGEKPQLHYIVTVSTHGPFAADAQKDSLQGVDHPGVGDYHQRLSAAIDELVKFEAALRKRGRPYVLIAFGDHLPGIRLHQWKMGWHSEKDERLHQVPVLVASNSEDAAALAKRLDQRPLFCITPVLLNGLRLPVNDRYMGHVAGQCDANAARSFVPADPVIQHQLFTKPATN